MGETLVSTTKKAGADKAGIPLNSAIYNINVRIAILFLPQGRKWQWCVFIETTLAEKNPAQNKKIPINTEERWHEIKGPQTVLVASSNSFQPALQAKCCVRNSTVDWLKRKTKALLQKQWAARFHWGQKLSRIPRNAVWIRSSRAGVYIERAKWNFRRNRNYVIMSNFIRV